MQLKVNCRRKVNCRKNWADLANSWQTSPKFILQFTFISLQFTFSHNLLVHDPAPNVRTKKIAYRNPLNECSFRVIAKSKVISNHTFTSYFTIVIICTYYIFWLWFYNRYTFLCIYWCVYTSTIPTKYITSLTNYVFSFFKQYHNMYLVRAVRLNTSRAQLFTSLMVDLRQDINIVSSFNRCLNGTFPWRNCSAKTLVY